MIMIIIITTATKIIIIPNGIEILGWHQAGDSCVSWPGWGL